MPYVNEKYSSFFLNLLTMEKKESTRCEKTLKKVFKVFLPIPIKVRTKSWLKLPRTGPAPSFFTITPDPQLLRYIQRKLIWFGTLSHSKTEYSDYGHYYPRRYLTPMNMHTPHLTSQPYRHRICNNTTTQRLNLDPSLIIIKIHLHPSMSTVASPPTQIISGFRIKWSHQGFSLYVSVLHELLE